MGILRMPDDITNKEVQEGIQTVLAKKQSQHENYIDFYKMREGKSVQMVHIGAFDKEPESLNKMNEFMKANDFAKNGLHHEIYLSDFNKTPAEKLKTILRE